METQTEVDKLNDRFLRDLLTHVFLAGAIVGALIASAIGIAAFKLGMMFAA